MEVGWGTQPQRWDILRSQQMLVAIKCFVDGNIGISARQCTGASCVQHSAKLSTSFLLSYGPITVQSLTPLTVRVIQQHEYELK